MATIDSAASGNFTSGATWVGGVVPTVGDTAVVLSGHIVTIDSEITCDEITGANNSGYFDLLDGGIINANVTGGATEANNGTLRYNGTVSATINGNITQTTGTNTTFVVVHTGNNLFNVVGNVRAGEGTSRHAINSTGASAQITVTGNLIGRSASAINATGASAQITVTGNVTASLNTSGINSTGTSAQITVTGNVTGGSNVSGIGATGASAQITVTGNVTGGSGSGARAINATGASAQITVTGNVAGGTFGEAINATGTSSNVDVAGTLNASPLAHAIDSRGQVVFDGSLFDALNGKTAMRAARRRARVATNVQTVYTTPEISNADGSPVIRASLDFVTNNVPVPADVREGLVYADDQFTGTLAVPPVEAVAAGVPVDDTVGTATLNIDVVGALFEAFESN